MGIAYLLPVAVIIAGAYCLGRQRIHRKRQRQAALRDLMSGIPPDRMPDLGRQFAAYLCEVHGFDPAGHNGVEQAKYLAGKLGRCWRPEAARFFSDLGLQHRELFLAAAAAAHLGEVVRAKHPNAHWIHLGDLCRNVLEIEYAENETINFDPCAEVFDRFFGSAEDALTNSQLLFDSPASLVSTIENERRGNLYSPEEMAAYSAAIEKNLGSIRSVWHEKISIDRDIDVFIVDPGKESPFVRLVTCGMGAQPMPLNHEARAAGMPDRVELAIDLPRDWPLDAESLQDERRYWPIRLLKTMARYPLEADTWLGVDHTARMPEPLSPDSRLQGILVALPKVPKLDEIEYELSPGKNVLLLQLVPLYPEEMAFKVEHGADKLLERFGDKFSTVVNPGRENVAAGA